MLLVFSHLYNMDSPPPCPSLICLKIISKITPDGAESLRNSNVSQAEAEWFKATVPPRGLTCWVFILPLEGLMQSPAKREASECLCSEGVP